MTNFSLKSRSLLGLSLVMGAILATDAAADVVMPAVVSKGMVLQQDSEVPIWGWATPGERVEVKATWGTGKYLTKADADGEWRVLIRTPSATMVIGTQSIVIKGKNSVQIDDILIGEVWLCSGQSNMEMFVGGETGLLGGVDRWQEELQDADYPEIRMFDVANEASVAPKDDCKGSWSACTPERAARFSAAAFFFGRELHRELRVPVGLITSDWGGTPVRAWTSLRGLKSQGGFESWTTMLEQARDHPEAYKNQQIEAVAAWRASLDGSDLGVREGWMKPEFADASWKSSTVPGAWSGELGAFDGIAWFRRSFECAPADAGKPCVLELGPIDDHDETWLNGVKVGEHFEPGSHATERVYTVPAGVLRAGANVVAVRVLDTGGAGGLCGSAAGVRLRIIDGGNTPLAGAWKWSKGAALADLARRPEAVAPSPYGPSMLYNGMIAPIVGYGIRGFAWYQGESDRAEAFRYRTMFRTMIQDWREVWERGALAFHFVQIAPFRYGGDRGETAELREAQAMALSLPNTGMAVTMDIGDAADIHPRNKQEVGHRLALSALAVTYKKSNEFSGPVYKSMQVEGGALRLTFDHAAGMTLTDKPLTCFTIAGEDKVFVPAEATIDGSTIVVRSAKVPAPAAVRFAWGDADQPNLKNGAGLPAGPFRTDQWPGVTQPVEKK